MPIAPMARRMANLAKNSQTKTVSQFTREAIMRRDHRRLMATLAFVGGAVLATPAWAQSTNLTVEVLSSRPELVTGGDALVHIGAAEAPKVSVGTTDVSGIFKSDQKGGWVGLVAGLKDGPNQLVATASGKEAKLTLVNHPLNGSLIAGPQQQPFVCENESHGLASPTDASCAAPAIVKYYYRNRAGAWRPFDPNAARPNDIGMTKTSEGQEVPLIVRIGSSRRHHCSGCAIGTFPTIRFSDSYARGRLPEPSPCVLQRTASCWRRWPWRACT